MKLATIQGRMGLLFLAFFLLVIVSVGITFWGIESQKADALVINLAGRQRMLIQQMTRLAGEIEEGDGETRRIELTEAANTFDRSLEALRSGGEAPYTAGKVVEVPAARDPAISEQLERVSDSWEIFRGALTIIASTDPQDPRFGEAITTVEQLSPEFVTQTDAAVQMYEAASNQKVTRLRRIQIGFFASAVILLGIGGWVTRNSVLEPLKQLKKAAERIGSGDLASPVKPSGQGEIRVLADTFESMRGELRASQEKLLAWTNLLEDRVAQRTSELEALYQVSRDISSRLDVQHVLRSVTDKARELLHAEVAFLCLLDQDGKVLNLHATSGPREAVIRSSALVQSGLANQVLSGERALPCGVEGCMGSCGIVAERFRVSHLAAPLRMGDRVIGALCVGSPENAVFSADAESLLTKLANSAAIALENARLYDQAERLAILEERQRIAADMHDGLAQTLSFAQVSVDLASNHIQDGQLDRAEETLRGVEKGLDQAVAEIRQAIASLQEDFPIHYTLQQQLGELVREVSNEKEISIHLKSEVLAPLVLPHQDAEQVLRVVREALLNARRHSQAKEITVRLSQANGYNEVSVADDGIGFDREAQPRLDGRSHFGLNIMQARAERLGGQLEIHSSPGKGTMVKLRWQQES